MKSIFYAAAMSCSIALGSTGDSATNQKEREKDLLDMIFSPEKQDSMGLPKLEEDERLELVKVFRSLIRNQAANATAAKYLKKEGWELLSVSGSQRAKLSEYDIEREWIVVSDGISKYAVEKPWDWVEPGGGEYWGKMDVLGPSYLIDSLGNEVDLFLQTKHDL